MASLIGFRVTFSGLSLLLFLFFCSLNFYIQVFLTSKVFEDRLVFLVNGDTYIVLQIAYLVNTEENWEKMIL